MSKHYKSAVKFLLKRIPRDNPRSILDEYIGKSIENDNFLSLTDVFKLLLSSAQNANMKTGVIGGSINGFTNLENALFGFNPSKVRKYFADDPVFLLAHIQETAQPRGQMRTAAKSIWPKYCKTVLAAENFLSQFKSGSDFRSWADNLYSDERTMAALPLIIEAEIEGIGYVLACDFLKELGYTNYGKPDVHVKDIFVSLGLCLPNAKPYRIQKAIAQIAKTERVSSYDVDKVFWLIGSGEFYKHQNLGKKGHIGSMKN